MKHVKEIAGGSVLLVLIIMGIVLFCFEKEDMPDTDSVQTGQIEYYLNEEWKLAVLDHGQISETDLSDGNQMYTLVQDMLADKKYAEVSLPYKGCCKADDIVVFQKKLPEHCRGLTMNFTSQGASVEVILDQEIIYQYNADEENIRHDWMGSHTNNIDLPGDYPEGDITILMTSPEPDRAAVLDIVRVIPHDMVVVGVVGNNITDIGCCLLMMIVAVIMFVLALIRRYTCQPPRGEFLLGLAGMSAGSYFFIGTDTLSIFYDIHEAYVIQDYLLLLIPLFLTFYFKWNLYKYFPRRFLLLTILVIMNGTVQMAIHLLGIRNLNSMIFLSATAVAIVCVTGIVSLIQTDYRKRNVETHLAILAMLILFTGGVSNIILELFFHVYGQMAGQYGMTIFCVIMAVVHVLQISKEYRISAERNAKLLEEKVKAAEQQNIQLARAKKDADAARHEALAANEAKGKFLAHMSHEIRTPINAVLGMDEMILRESKEKNIKEYAMDIYTAGQTLLSLINDILDFSKIESGKMEIVPVEYDISSMIHDLANMASRRAENKHISLWVEVDEQIPSRLYGDDVRIRQVLTNILTNAVKYTNEGTVWLRIKSCVTGDRVLLKFEVEDTGIGIKEEDLPKLSAEFERIEEDRNRNIEGTGLGMSITIQLLALLGSRLEVESVYGSGSKFYFELEQKIVDHTPVGNFESRVHQIAEDYSYDSDIYAPDAEILVTDDNAVNRKVLRHLLKETGIRVTEAEGGRQCLELVQENHYDLIFLDHMMPEMDGIETLHQMKELTDFPCQDTPVVVLTANAVSGAKEKYLAEGFDDFLSKPVVPEKLDAMIRKMLPDDLFEEAADRPAQTEAQQIKPEAADDWMETLPPVDGLDWQYACMHLPDRELLEFTVKEFYDQIDSAADLLEQAYGRMTEDGQMERYRIQVHAMKSLAATVGILPLSGVAKILEYAARDGRADVIRSMTTVFLEEWRSYRDRLRGVFGMDTVAGKEVTDYTVMQALVEMVRLSMQEMDIDQADQLMGQLKAYDYPGDIGQNIRKLGEAVTNLDPEEADRSAELLIRQMKEQTV